MGYPRKSLVCLDDTPYYHVIARCVRRAWLWGVDDYAGRDYSHRKQWVLERLAFLSSIFSIDLCAYAVMSNHYHLVLHVDRARMRACSPRDIAHRWAQLFRLPSIVSRWQDGVASEPETALALQLIDRWRQRLLDVSWFMRCLNEHLARRANAEDGCTGRFWEGRFKSQALLDEAGLLTAMAYVDLNPVRAGIAALPEDAEFTSIQARLQQLRPAARATPPTEPNLPALMAFQDQLPADTPALPMRWPDYLQLVEATGRVLRADKRGAIEPHTAPILARLHIDPHAWHHTLRARGNLFGRALGRLDRLRLHARAIGQSRIKGLTQAQRLFRTA